MTNVSTTPLTPLSFLQRSARVFPTKPAVIYGPRTWTYGEFEEEARRVANALTVSGVKPGDRVAYLMPNLPEMLLAHYAVPLAGAVLVAINTRLSSEEINYILRHSDARVLVTDAAFLETVADAVTDLPGLGEVVSFTDELADAPGSEAAVSSIGHGLVGYAEFRARGNASDHRAPVVDENGPIALNYTSGTTGRPKGVIYTHRGAYLNSFGEIVHSVHTPQSVYLWTLPMFHCNGWCRTWALTGIGGTHVCLRGGPRRCHLG